MDSKGIWGYLVPCCAESPPIDLQKAEVLAGRDHTCDIVLKGEQLGCKHENISKNHFQLLHGTQGAMLKDVSRTGTFVNGRPVGRGKQVALSHGARIDIIRFGIKAFVYLDRAISDGGNYPKMIKDKFIMGQQLGEGGFGQVFLVLEKASLQRYAMKMVKNSRVAKREAEILCEIKHPCMIRAYEIFTNQDHLYLVLEYLAGGDLSRWVNDKKLLSEKQTKLLFYQLALAVQYMHQNSITHRDLKPANILLVHNSPHTLIKVTDFGLAKDEELHSDMTTCAGTEVYLAPEVMISSPYTNKVDIWSMGVILYYSLSGALPFNSLNEARRIQHQVRYTPDKWRYISLTALELVKRMLVASPERRASVSEVLGTAWLQDEPMKADAHTLMGLHVNQPAAPAAKNAVPPINNPVPQRARIMSPARPAAVSPARLNVASPAHHKAPSPATPNRQPATPRGVLQYLSPSSPKAATPPAQVAAVSPNGLRARPQASPIAVKPYRPGQFAAAVDIKVAPVHKAQKTFLLEARKNLKPAWKP